MQNLQLSEICNHCGKQNVLAIFENGSAMLICPSCDATKLAEAKEVSKDFSLQHIQD
jgi:ssDNA-binding Zn-finger/Zn-ribbon topoisomerase 1